MASDGLPVTTLERIRRRRVLEADRQEAAARLGFRGSFGSPASRRSDEGPFAQAALRVSVDLSGPARPRSRDEATAERQLPLPCSAADLDWAGEALGFPLPATVQQLYLEVGNGGFGPDNGFFGLERLVAEYQDLTGEPPAPGAAAWPAALLPIADLEPGLVCLDVASGRILDWAPAGLEEDEDEWEGTFSDAAPDLVHWLNAWLDRS